MNEILSIGIPARSITKSQNYHPRIYDDPLYAAHTGLKVIPFHCGFINLSLFREDGVEYHVSAVWSGDNHGNMTLLEKSMWIPLSWFSEPLFTDIVESLKIHLLREQIERDK